MESSFKYRIKNELFGDAFSVPKKLLKKLNEAGETELKIALLLSSHASLDDGEFQSQMALSLGELGISDADYKSAVAFLRGAGLLERATAPKKEEKPQKAEKKASLSERSYTSKELADAYQGEFRELVDYTTGRLGGKLNHSDISTLYSFYEYLCMPFDVIMLAIEHCASEGKSSLRYVEKLLIHFADNEINTYQKAETYFLERREYLSFENRVRSIMGISSRALTAKEKTLFSQWKNLALPEELITLAYERMVDKIGKVSVSYMNTILESWHSSGFKSVAEVERGDSGKKDGGASGFDPDAFFRAAVESDDK